MPMGYWQCPICREVFRSKYKTGERPKMLCHGSKADAPHEEKAMTFRGDGWDGRENLPHGKPPSWSK